MTEVKKIYFFTGLPCSGKSHAAKLLANKFDCDYISTGDIARSLIKTEQEASDTAKNDRYAGEDELRVELKRRIESCTKNTIIVDGFPRFADQARYMVNEYTYYFPVVVEINAGDDITLYNRAFMRKRDQQDNMDVFKARLESAKKNLSDVHQVMTDNLHLVYVIMSGNDESTINQFARIVRGQKIK